MIHDLVSNDQIIKMQKIITNMVVKLEKEAEANETDKSEKAYQVFKKAAMERSRIEEYSFTELEVARCIPRLSKAEVERIVSNSSEAYNILEKEELERLLSIKRKQVCENYIEYNAYYRMILGKPPLNHSEKDFVYVNDVPIHELQLGDINALKFSGELDLIITRYDSNPEYRYLKYLDKGIDIWRARESALYEILYLDNKEDSIEYRKYYNEERKVFIRTYSSKYLNSTTEYNEAYELNYIKFMALSRMQMNRYSPILDKDSYTVEEAIDKWKEFGLSFPKNMPAVYRNTTTFLLNYLTLYKGTNYIMEFISKRLFTGIDLYKYYITKKPKPNLKYPIPEETPPWEVYDVEFVMVPFSEFYTEHLNSENRKVLTYNDIVERDPKWQNTDELKKAVFSEDFSFVESKYLGMNFYVDLERFSLDFSTMINIFLKNRDKLETVSVYYQTSGTSETFFNIFIYFLALFGYLLQREQVKDPNTLTKYKDEHVYGFNVPDDFESFRVQFIKFFFNTPYRHIMNDFPEAINEGDVFFQCVEKMDDQVRFVENFDNLVFYCNSHLDYLFLNRLIRLVTLVRTNPNVMQMEEQTVDGMTYVEYLRKHAPNLYNSFMYLVSTNVEQNYAMEFDNIIQLLIDALDEDRTDDINLVGKLQSLLSDSSVFVNGINKYLLFILKTFKAYSADFLTEQADFNLTTQRNYLKQIDQINFNVDIDMEEHYNNTQIDKIIIDKTPPNYSTTQRTRCTMILHTPYGDVEMETK